MDKWFLNCKEWNLSMMRISYKLTKGTKTEKYKKFLKINNIINFNNFCYKLTALSNSILRLHERLKKPKTANSEKNERGQ